MGVDPYMSLLLAMEDDLILVPLTAMLTAYTPYLWALQLVMGHKRGMMKYVLPRWWSHLTMILLVYMRVKT